VLPVQPPDDDNPDTVITQTFVIDGQTMTVTYTRSAFNRLAGVLADEYVRRRNGIETYAEVFIEREGKTDSP
jgi:hypothetical protein